MAAKSLIDFRLSGKPSSSTIIHLIHPRPTTWLSLAKSIAAELSIPLVPFSEWLAKLEQSGKSKTNGSVEVEDLRRIPALRLLPFFKSMSARVEDSPNAFGFPILACEMAAQLSGTLSDPDIPQLSENDARKWVRYWRKVGFIQG